MAKKIYISGQITRLKGYEHFFDEAEQRLRAKGFETVNPTKLPHKHDKTWEAYMKEDIIALMRCDAIYMLSNWGESKGAAVELELAIHLKMEVTYE